MESLTSTGAAPARASTRPHVVLVASPGAGHLIPLAELARRLAEHHGFAATLVTFTGFSSPEAMSCLPDSLATAALPAVQIDDLPHHTPIEILLFELVRRSVPNLRALLRSIDGPIAALVPDFFCSAALPLAAELGVPGYLFVPSNLAVLALMRRLVDLHHGVGPGEEYRDMPENLELPGGVALRRADLPVSFQRSSAPQYARLLEEGRRYLRADGFLVNSFYELEPATAEEFRQAAEQGVFPPVFAVGPFVRSRSSDGAASSACIIDWLDLQPTGSVVYVSFGSGGSLSVEQTAELAAGLEASGHRFLWVVRMPVLDGTDENNARVRSDDPLAWLPEGFLERTKGRGLAVAAWAPQVRVLSHPATAVFVSHCGWNSALESVSAGVPMVALPPRAAEQRMNAVILEQSVGVALRPRVQEKKDQIDGNGNGDGGVVARDEIAAVLKELMEGDKGRAVRRQAGDLQQAAALAWTPEGSSRRALEEVAAAWKSALGKGKM